MARECGSKFIYTRPDGTKYLLRVLYSPEKSSHGNKCKTCDLSREHKGFVVSCGISEVYDVTGDCVQRTFKILKIKHPKK